MTAFKFDCTVDAPHAVSPLGRRDIERGSAAALFRGSLELDYQRSSWGPRRLRLVGRFKIKEDLEQGGIGAVLTLARWNLVTVYGECAKRGEGVLNVPLNVRRLVVCEVQTDA